MCGAGSFAPWGASLATRSGPPRRTTTVKQRAATVVIDVPAVRDQDLETVPEAHARDVEATVPPCPGTRTTTSTPSRMRTETDRVRTGLVTSSTSSELVARLGGRAGAGPTTTSRAWPPVTSPPAGGRTVIHGRRRRDPGGP